jgi:hypothetical protein
LKSTRNIDILSEVLNSFHFFFFHEEISEASLDYMLANINKLIIVMMWILQSYNQGKEEESKMEQASLEDAEKKKNKKLKKNSDEDSEENLNDSFDFFNDSSTLINLSKHTIRILKENINKMINFSPLMTTFLDQNCKDWKKAL